VLLGEDDYARFDAYCRERGHKKSTLIARLVRDHLAQEGFALQTKLNLGPPGNPKRQRN